MALAFRLLRALVVFGLILGSYLFQLALARPFRRRGAVPDWIRTRRARVDQTNARRLLRGMLRLRGVFIKLGQILSIMGGFLPRLYAKELEQLQDRVPPQPFSDIGRAI